MSGWVKLHRSLKDWQYYDDKNAVLLLIHLLVSVNYEPKKWREITIEAGQFVCSWDSLSRETGLSKQQVRSSMTKLERSKEVTRKATNKYQLISLVKWEELQKDKEEITDKPTDKQHSNNTQITPTKETKEIKEIKKRKSIEERKTEFKNSLSTFLKQYGSDMLNDFYLYWTEHGERDRKMRFEKQKSFGISLRLATWYKNEQKFKANENGNNKGDKRRDAIKTF